MRKIFVLRKKEDFLHKDIRHPQNKVSKIKVPLLRIENSMSFDRMFASGNIVLFL